MFVIIAIDALEYELVNEFNCNNLKQDFFGKTDISDFSQPRTMVLWSSFLTGENKEEEVLENGDKKMWNKRWELNETFLNSFKNPLVLDLPGYSYDLETHEKSRILLKDFFEEKDPDKKEEIKKLYNKDAFDHHKKIKEEFLAAITKGENDLIIGYFSVADVIGHLNFGNRTMMKIIYTEMDELVGNMKNRNDKLIVISDHGMKAIGNFGDHSEYGFWSTNFKDLNKGSANPKITDFYKLITENK